MKYVVVLFLILAGCGSEQTPAPSTTVINYPPAPLAPTPTPLPKASPTPSATPAPSPTPLPTPSPKPAPFQPLWCLASGFNGDAGAICTQANLGSQIVQIDLSRFLTSEWTIWSTVVENNLDATQCGHQIYLGLTDCTCLNITFRYIPRNLFSPMRICGTGVDPQFSYLEWL